MHAQQPSPYSLSLPLVPLFCAEVAIASLDDIQAASKAGDDPDPEAPEQRLAAGGLWRLGGGTQGRGGLAGGLPPLHGGLDSSGVRPGVPLPADILWSDPQNAPGITLGARPGDVGERLGGLPVQHACSGAC